MEKLIWIEKLNTFLSIVNTTWNKTILKTGDMIISYLEPSVALKRYKEVIETYNLKQDIVISTRKGTNTLIMSLQTYKRINYHHKCSTMSNR